MSSTCWGRKPYLSPKGTWVRSRTSRAMWPCSGSSNSPNAVLLGRSTAEPSRTRRSPPSLSQPIQGLQDLIGLLFRSILILHLHRHKRRCLCPLVSSLVECTCSWTLRKARFRTWTPVLSPEESPSLRNIPPSTLADPLVTWRATRCLGKWWKTNNMLVGTVVRNGQTKKSNKQMFKNFWPRLMSDCSNRSCLHSSPGDATPLSSPQTSNKSRRRILACGSPWMLSSCSSCEFHSRFPHILPDKHALRLAGWNRSGREAFLWRSRTTSFGKESLSILPGHILSFEKAPLPHFSPPSRRARNKSAPPPLSACLLGLARSPLPHTELLYRLSTLPLSRYTCTLHTTVVLLGSPSRAFGG